MHGFESCGLWPRNRFKIGDEEYVVLDEDANLSETAEVSQDLATERQQEQTDTLTCVAKSNQTTEQEQTEKVEYPQLSEVPTTHPPEKQQDQCLEEKAKECSLGMKVNISNTETVRATFEIISPLRGILGIAKRKTYERIMVRRKEDENNSWYCKLCQEDVKENMIKCTQFSIGKRVRCPRNLGCFGTGPPFAQPKRRPISYLPNSREFIRTKFLLYTRRDPWFNEILIPDQIETIEISKFNSQLPTKVIIHGYVDSTLLTTWMKRLTRVLFSVGDYNVIIVDWFIGSTFSSYIQAVANARVVGAEIAFLMERLQDFHLICHSLGAHVCGYAGKRLSDLGRITGLDPAGPYFHNVSRHVRLDASDAMFVDIIHTNAAESIFKGLGTNEMIGHVDFFPNGGHNNPGCKTLREKKKSRTFLEFIRPQLECDHRRAIEFFIASIKYPECFVAVSCRSYLDFAAGRCSCSDETPCAFMGFYADQFEHLIRNTSGIFYLDTSSDYPYCAKNRLIFNYKIKTRSLKNH
ncbi:pancreatic lipase-related protein 2-like [Centruroides sculpturatus]|uniref:pancreatic lipase-related protein 2-like n=1 Tax=Centruroides sculpturatus TaxID=218467 RepID=UPI000C6EF177|nr:pancreatic lipase-related protein 2-like [Centruroides sculpturatus]